MTEAGPDSFLSQKPAGLELCDKLGLTDQLIKIAAPFGRDLEMRAFLLERATGNLLIYGAPGTRELDGVWRVTNAWPDAAATANCRWRNDCWN